MCLCVCVCMHVYKLTSICMEVQRSQNGLLKKNKAIRLRWSDFQIYRKTALIKIMWSEPNAAHVDQRNEVKSTEKDPHINVHLFMTKVQFSKEKKTWSFLVNGAYSMGSILGERMNLTSYHTQRKIQDGS